jgi:hypothetical protein
MHGAWEWKNMNWFSLFFSNWRVIGVAILLLTIGYQHIRNQSAESEIEELKIQSRLETAVREQQVQEVKNRSDSTLRRINDEHAKLVEQAQARAVANFRRKYVDVSGGSHYSNFSGDLVLRLPSAAGADGNSSASSPKSPNGTREGIMAIDSGLLETFAIDCARDAGTIKLWQDWATSNNFPIEK